MDDEASADTGFGAARLACALAAWAVGALLMLLLDDRVDLPSLAMLVVLSSAVASLWLPVWASALASVLAMLAFNWSFVPPRGSFTVDLHQHLLLLAAMLGVNWIVAALMAAQRRQTRLAKRHAQRAEELRAWGDALRDADAPLAHAGLLHAQLSRLAGGAAALLVLKEALPQDDDAEAVLLLGVPDSEQRAALWHCLRRARAMGPGSAHQADLRDCYLPLRGRGGAWGAAVLDGRVRHRDDPGALRHAQALCDQLGVALERAASARAAQQASAQAQEQAVRNAMLAAISHDYRTPLASILGAATALQEQDARLDAAQRRRLADSIAEETRQLGRLTDNTLQLARLDGHAVPLACDWESAEELFGACLRKARRRDPGRRLRARIEPGLPLLWCDALLMAQLLDNLVDNALKYSPDAGPVELLARRIGEQAVLAVRDRGPGIAPASRQRIFEVFQRGAEPLESAGSAPVMQRARPGAGVGLAVCRAIARAHGGELRVRGRGHGGCSFECSLPLRAPPAEPLDAARDAAAAAERPS